MGNKRSGALHTFAQTGTLEQGFWITSTTRKRITLKEAPPRKYSSYVTKLPQFETSGCVTGLSREGRALQRSPGRTGRAARRERRLALFLGRCRRPLKTGRK